MHDIVLLIMFIDTTFTTADKQNHITDKVIIFLFHHSFIIYITPVPNGPIFKAKFE